MKQKNHKIKFGILLATNFFSFVLFMIFAFITGSASKRIQFNARLLNLNDLQNNQSSYFTHLIIDNTEIKDSNKKLLNLRSLQNKTYSKEKMYQSYVVSYANNSIKKFPITKLEGKGNDFQINDWEESPVVTLSTFSDSQTCNTISLYLYKNLGMNHAPKYGATIGCYISSSTADKIISSNDNINSYDDILNNNLVFTLFSEYQKKYFTISINNIYFTTPQENKDFSIYSKRNHNYEATFETWAKDAIITPDTRLFENCESALAVDLCKKYGNARNYFRDVIGYDYANSGYNIKWQIENFDDPTLFGLELVSKNYNDFNGIVPLILAIIFGMAFIISNTFGIMRCNKKIFYYLPIAIFVIFALIWQVFTIFVGFNYIYLTAINYLGFLFIIIILLVSTTLFWGKFLHDRVN